MPDPDATAAEQAVARFAECVRRAHEEVTTAIAAIEDPQQALTHANDFFQEAEALYEEASRLRTQTVGRIWEAEELTLTELANRISVSRQRVGQIAKAYRQGKEE
jgi:DNA-directed RNA polymerase specialized sigma subunit